MKNIPLYRKEGNGRWGQYILLGVNALVDDSDEELVLSVSTHWLRHSDGYAYTNVNSKAVLMHRLILGLTDSKIHTDHWDHNRLNNQRSNIRPVTQAENNANLPFTGVGRFRSKWRAWTPSPTQHLGVFETRQEAEAAVANWYRTKTRNVRERQL